MVFFSFAFDQRLVIGISDDFEGPKFTIFLDDGVGKLSSDQSLGVEYGVFWVSGYLVFSCVSDQNFVVGKSNIRGGCSKTLVVSDNFNFTILPYSYTRVGGS